MIKKLTRIEVIEKIRKLLKASSGQIHGITSEFKVQWYVKPRERGVKEEIESLIKIYQIDKFELK